LIAEFIESTTDGKEEVGMKIDYLKTFFNGRYRESAKGEDNNKLSCIDQLNLAGLKLLENIPLPKQRDEAWR
jgi:hypothetical protein